MSRDDEKAIRRKWFEDGKKHGKGVTAFIDLGDKYKLEDLTEEAINQLRKNPQSYYRTSTIPGIERDVDVLVPDKRSLRYDKKRMKLEDIWEAGFKHGITEDLPLHEAWSDAVKEFKDAGKDGEYGNPDDNLSLVSATRKTARRVVTLNDPKCIVNPDSEECAAVIGDLEDDLFRAYEDNYEYDEDVDEDYEEED